MSKKVKSASRLSIVFIVTLAISGSLLTYFSINTISNFKELTEKKVQEEEAELARWFIESINLKLDEATSLFQDKTDSTEIEIESLLKLESSNSLIQFPFILNNKGTFLFPNFPEEPQLQEFRSSSAKFTENFTAGETAEFLNSDYETASRLYLSAFNQAISNQDKAQVINVLGRVSIKRNKKTSAFNYYKSIILNYYSEYDKNDFPFVYYAVPQLIKISSSVNSDSVLSLFNSFLSKLKYGHIPINFSTEDINQQISDWLAKQSFKNTNNKQLAESLIEQINHQTRFLQTFGEIIKGHLQTGNGQTVSDSSEFKPVNVPSFENNLLFLINTEPKNPLGFAINGDTLFDFILKEIIPSEFEYVFEISEWQSNTINNKGLIFNSQLNPYFPGHQILIKPANENLINDYVSRQSWIYGILLVLLIAGMTLGIILILRDISREKQLARLRSDFISNVTHELKTPLTSIYMFTESILLKRLKKESDKDEYLSAILKESERLKRMINNILEFSKMEKGKSDYHFRKANVSDILKAAIGDLDYWLEEKSFEVKTELDKTIVAEIDPEKIKQAIENLVNNAVKYSNEKRNIIIRLFSEKEKICIEVEDFGIGIPANQQERIFEKFYRVGQTESLDISGTGLGLTVVKEIIETHGGQIKVSSEVGKGSKFSIYLKQL